MSADRVVRWTKESRRPNRAELRHLLEDFFAGAGSVHWDGDRFYVDLPGTPTHALRRLATIVLGPFPEGYTRWIEVWPSRESLYVTTRRADDFTNALAEGLRGLLVRFFGGEAED